MTATPQQAFDFVLCIAISGLRVSRRKRAEYQRTCHHRRDRHKSLILLAECREESHIALRSSHRKASRRPRRSACRVRGAAQRLGLLKMLLYFVLHSVSFRYCICLTVLAYPGLARVRGRRRAGVREPEEALHRHLSRCAVPPALLDALDMAHDVRELQARRGKGGAGQGPAGARRCNAGAGRGERLWLWSRMTG